MRMRLFKCSYPLALAALLAMGCASPAAQPTATPTSTPGTGGAGLPNPAAVYCQEQGGKSEIRTAADGSQYGVCVFADGSECDEWAYFRKECKPGEGKVEPTPAPTMQQPTAAPIVAGELPTPEGETVDGWTGTVVKLPAGYQFGQYFARDDGQRYDIGSADEAVAGQIAEARWTGATVKVWGRLFTGVPALQGRHVEVERLEVVAGVPQEVRDLAPLAQLTASSTLPADHTASYYVYTAADGSLETAWVEGADGPGAAEWLMLTFPRPVVLERIGVDVGYDRDAEAFAANNRLKTATAIFSDGGRVELSFADGRGVQSISLAAPVETTSVKLVIEEVYPGAKYDDTCLAEVQVWGTTR